MIPVTIPMTLVTTSSYQMRARSGKIEDTTVEDFDHLFAVNVQAPFFPVQQFSADPALRQ
jgi:NAD(P)-dependent dehydrogenase (short-subunit alcohol dehydrogenase family)